MRLQSLKLIIRLVAAVVTAATSIAFASFLPSSLTQATSADWVKTMDNTGLSTTGIAVPQASNDSFDAWQGSYIFFGKDSGKPIKFRVVAPRTEDYGGSTMFLNSDDVLFDYEFDCDGVNEWKDCGKYIYSDLYMYLNFKMLYDSFDPVERDSIFTSTTKGGEDLDEDKIFVPSADEVVSSSAAARNGDVYWLRTPDASCSDLVKVVDSEGKVTVAPAKSKLGVAPALNIDLDSVLFASVISGNPGKTGATYKLTLLDKDIELSSSNEGWTTVLNSKVTVPFAISGENAYSVNQMSVLILSDKYQPANANGNNILYYAPFDSSDLANGEGTFTLPSDLDISGWGTDYHVYILAENINGVKETDYSSNPVEVVMFENN